MNPGLFRAASLQTRRAPFSAPGFPAIYAACATGLAWTCSWQAVQTMSVLRRILAMRAAHAGWPGPGSPSALRLVTWWAATVGPGSQSSRSRLGERCDQLLGGWGGGGGGGVTDAPPPVLPQDDPAESCYQVLPALAVLPGLETGPQPVTGLEIGRAH